MSSRVALLESQLLLLETENNRLKVENDILRSKIKDLKEKALSDAKDDYWQKYHDNLYE